MTNTHISGPAESAILTVGRTPVLSDRTLGLLRWVLAAGAVVLIVSSYLRWPLWPDHSLYLYMGQQWGQGRIPYRDVFDQNWPGIIWLSQAIEGVFGVSPVALRAFDLVWQAASCLVLFGIARVYLSRHWALACITLYGALYLAPSFGSTAQRETFACLPLGLCMFLLARPRTAALFSHGVAGVLLAFAVLLKPTLGIAWPFVLLWLLVEREDTVLGKKRAAAFSLGMVSVITAVIFYFAELSLLGPFADATFAFGLRYSALSWLWVGGRLITFLLLYPPGRLVLFSIALAAILCIRKRDLMDRKYTLLVVFTLAALCSLVIQRRFAYYHSVPFCFFGSLFVLVGCRYFAEHIHKDSPSPGGRRWLIPVIVVVILFPFGRDLPLSALSCLAGQSTAAYGDQRRLERGLAPWSVVQEIGRAIRIGTPETASVLCLTGSDCPDFYLAGGRPPATKYVQPQHFGFDPMRQREAAALVANSCGVTAIVYNAATLPGIMDIYVAATKSSSTRVLLQRVVDNQRSFLVMSARRTTCPSETGAGSNSTIRGENASRKTGD